MRHFLRLLTTIIIVVIYELVLILGFQITWNPLIVLGLFLAAPFVAWPLSDFIVKPTKKKKTESGELVLRKEPNFTISVSTEQQASLSDGYSARLLQDDLDQREGAYELELLELPVQLQNLRPTYGRYQTSASNSTSIYSVDLDKQTCDCQRFEEKQNFPKGHMGRICEHLFVEMDRQKAFVSLHHMVLTALTLGLREQTREAYALKHPELPMMYVVIGESDEWINVYARKKLGNQTIYEASGDFERHGWSVWQKRWSYSSGPAGASLLREFFMSLTSVDDVSLHASQLDLARDTPNEEKPLSERSDPRENRDENADQFGPDRDAFDIPNGLKTSSTPLNVRINFRYKDSQNQKSRRTVEVKEIQYYGSEGEYIYGECLMRREGRTFKTARMWDVWDVDTGEIIEDVTAYLQRSYDESALGRLNVWMKGNERIARGWLYLLKANKSPSRTEYDILKHTFSGVLGGQVVTTDDVRNLFENVKVTTPNGFQTLVSGIKKHHPEEAQKFAEICRSLVCCRKNPNFADEAALKFVIEKIPLN